MLSLILPCYNEEDNLKNFKFELLDFISTNNIELILVNNGSSDNTENEINNYIKINSKIKKVNISINEGYGKGLYTGIGVASYDDIAWMHADFQVSLPDLLKGYYIYKGYKNGNCLVRGKRKKRKITDSFFTFFMSLITSAFFLRLINDSNATPTITSKKILEGMNNIPKDFCFDLFCHITAIQKKFKVIRYNVIYLNRIYGKTKWNFNFFSKFKLSFTVIKYILKKRFIEKNT